MGYWIRKVIPTGTEPPLIRWEAEPNGHLCSFPSRDELADAGPRSVWCCECGQRWRLTAPFWRPMGAPGAQDTDPADLPSWVRGLSRDPAATDDA